MQTPIYLALSRQAALRTQMDVIANNIANANTPGFKQQRVQFVEFLSRPAPREELSFVVDRAVRRDLTNGSLTSTGNPFDLALQGPGYFAVDTVNGPRYTRAGRFELNDQREVVNHAGLPLLGGDDQAIVIPPDVATVRINHAGELFDEANPQAVLGRIKVVGFENEQALLEVGGGLYTTDQEPGAAPEETSVQQGTIEDSNVQPVVEMTRMIETLRSYQSAQNLGRSEHERLRGALTRLGRTT